MAGDWIKVEHVTPGKPEMDLLADILDLPVDQILGILIRLWIWADQQTLDGNASRVTKSAIDRRAGVSGFADAMIDVGWLIADTTGICFVNFERHNGQTAKTRALTAKRVSQHKKRNANAASVTRALPREEKSKYKPHTPASTGLSDYPPDFEEFWSTYPKKVGKGAALRAWRNAQTKPEINELCDIIAKQSSSPAFTKENGQYIPHPATWLNQRRWEDEVSTRSIEDGSDFEAENAALEQRRREGLK